MMLWFLFGGVVLFVSLLPIFLAERWCRTHHQKQEFPVPKGMGWLMHTSIWLLDHLPESVRNSVWLKGCADIAAVRLEPGIKREKFRYHHEIKKMMLFYGSYLGVVSILILYSIFAQSKSLDDYRIEREDATGSSREVTVDAQIEGILDKKEMRLTIEPRAYAGEEKEALISKVKSYIDTSILGENADLSQIRMPLIFQSHYPGENVTIEWQCDDYNLIHQDGTLGDLTLYELPVNTKVTAIIHYADEQIVYEKRVCIVGVEKTEQEVIEEQLKLEMEKANANSAASRQMDLPREVNGKKVQWHYHEDFTMPMMILLGLGFIITAMMYQEQKLKTVMKTRTEQLLYDYPSFVHKMVLMMGAGMTARRCWNHIVNDYEREHKNCWLYKEMKYTSIQMQSGMSEVRAYMLFGRRTELVQYMKFTQLLLQSIKKGTHGMQEMMMQEAYEAQKQRRDLAKRLGETAGTKLLLPMMILLMIVLLVVMLPAFLSM